MLSFGFAAYTADEKLLDTFEANLEILPGAEADPRTMEWWKNQPEAWATYRSDFQPPERAVKTYLGWLKGLPSKLVFVGYPASYDFMFVY